MSQLLARAAEEAGVKPVPAAPHGVEATERVGEDGSRYPFLLNHSRTDAAWVKLPPYGATVLRLGVIWRV